MGRYLGKTAKGHVILASHYMRVEDEVESIIGEVLKRIEKLSHNSDAPTAIEVDMERIVGSTICVETTEIDEIVYAQKVGKNSDLSRFVKNREPEPSTKIVIIIKKIDDSKSILLAGFVGSKPEPEVWDRNKTEKSLEFWNTHALIYNKCETVSGTETTTCPWHD